MVIGDLILLIIFIGEGVCVVGERPLYLWHMTSGSTCYLMVGGTGYVRLPPVVSWDLSWCVN